MKWTKENYPIAMRYLDKEVRNKAIDIANSLVKKEQMDEGMAIPIAINQAKEQKQN